MENDTTALPQAHEMSPKYKHCREIYDWFSTMTKTGRILRTILQLSCVVTGISAIVLIFTGHLVHALGCVFLGSFHALLDWWIIRILYPKNPIKLSAGPYTYPTGSRAEIELIAAQTLCDNPSYKLVDCFTVAYMERDPAKCKNT